MTIPKGSASKDTSRAPRTLTGTPLLIGLAVFITCLIGIFSRLDQGLASIWFANAVLIGLLLRLKATTSVPAWLYSGVAFIAADLLTGSTLLKSVVLSSANMLGVAVTCLVYSRLPHDMRRLSQPMSALYMALACGAGAGAAGLVGAIANPLLFNGELIHGWVLWFVTEFANYIAILPVMLAAPTLQSARQMFSSHCPIFVNIKQSPYPLLALLASCIASLTIGGPGAIAFPVPALLWCAARYSILTTTLLTLITSAWLLTLLAQTTQFQEHQLISLRLGVALVALGPLMLACVMQSHNRLLNTLQHLASHDSLTNTYSRSAFIHEANKLLNSQLGAIAVMMIDLDYFKQVNDTYGHAAGDQVLVAASARIRNCLRSSDVLGRLGGEEFAVVISGLPLQEVQSIAERIRAGVANSPISLPYGGAICITTSIGLSITQNSQQLTIQDLLLAADNALYEAKRAGRNRVVLASETQQIVLHE